MAAAVFWVSKVEMNMPHTAPNRIPIDLALVIVLTLACILFVLTPWLDGSPVRVVLGLLLVLFLPGYSLVAALFPGRDDLGGIERIALSFGISIAVVPLIVSFTQLHAAREQAWCLCFSGCLCSRSCLLWLRVCGGCGCPGRSGLWLWSMEGGSGQGWGVAEMVARAAAGATVAAAPSAAGAGAAAGAKAEREGCKSLSRPFSTLCVALRTLR